MSAAGKSTTPKIMISAGVIQGRAATRSAHLRLCASVDRAEEPRRGGGVFSPPPGVGREVLGSLLLTPPPPFPPPAEVLGREFMVRLYSTAGRLSGHRLLLHTRQNLCRRVGLDLSEERLERCVSSCPFCICRRVEPRAREDIQEWFELG